MDRYLSFYRTAGIFSLAGFLLLGVSLLQPFSFTDNSYAEEVDKSASVDMSVTVEPVIEIWTTDTNDDTISAANIALDPDESIATTTVRTHVSTSNTTGYTLTIQSESTDAKMTHENESITKTIDPITGEGTSTTNWTKNKDLNNMWGYSIGNNDSYLGVPGSSSDTSTINEASGPSNDSSTDVTFAAKADATLPAGTYKDTVIFSAIANAPAPTAPCTEGCTIHYNANGGSGSMSDQTTIDGTSGWSTSINDENYTDVTLRARNFWRSGYGFAGWNTKADGTGTTYGPMASVDMSNLVDSNDEVTLYAKWIASTGDIQNFSCSSLTSVGQVTALKDSRDGDVYTVGKLADGKCWMMENLRLGSTSSLSITTSNSVTGGTVQASSNWNGTTNTTMYQNSNNTNTSLTASPNTNDAASSWYGYGNYYSWAQAIMNTSAHDTKYDKQSTSLCPVGWRLPSGMENDNNQGDFGKLSAALGYNQTTMDANSEPTGAEASKAFRAYPNNFVYSGYWTAGNTRAGGRGTYGSYWSSTAYGINYAYRLVLDSTYLYPGTDGVYKYSGFSVRCVTGS